MVVPDKLARPDSSKREKVDMNTGDDRRGQGHIKMEKKETADRLDQRGGAASRLGRPWRGGLNVIQKASLGVRRAKERKD